MVLIGIFLFYPHVDAILHSIARRADQIDSVKLGSLEINVKASALPTASKRLAEAMAKLDKDKIQSLMSMNVSLMHCGLADQSSLDNFTRNRQAIFATAAKCGTH